MGNLQTYINYYAPLNYSHDLNDQIIEIGQELHPQFGNIQIWRIKDSEEGLLFSFHTHIYKSDSSILEIHKHRCSMQHPNLLKYYACAHSNSQNIGKVQSQQFFFEYYHKCLKDQIQSSEFSEIQIWKVIEQIVDVMAYIQSLGRYHGHLSSDSIFLTDNNEIKLLEKLGQKPNENALKQDVYDLGIIGFQMLTKKTTQLNFIEELKSLVGKYTLQLLQLISLMVCKDPEKRPDFIQLKQSLQNRYFQAISCKKQQSPQKICLTQASFVNSDTKLHRGSNFQYQTKISPRIPQPQLIYQSQEIPRNNFMNVCGHQQFIQSNYQNFQSPVKQSKYSYNMSTADKYHTSPQRNENSPFVL